ncbi:hypothetical protein ASG89_18995 [Paenibacillus sp. Soil766]|uniref:DUF1361 domain-containing protein n=1 Tax=Paenibacillus sp. Soil766 TaxID=1736404 RepID=UPI00070D1BB2|nr:DUF1361 domain-containing protein [Paenibacillus sp. Soil766]KRF06544.1 hypothetical protein ASG89_18995 [Paenibacillus sp. Soil766]
MKNLNHKNLFIFLVTLSLINVVVYIICRNKTYFDFLNWNLFLAWIPLVLSSLVYLIYKRSKVKSIFLVLLGMLWLLFFPNSPYVITDLIHLTVKKDLYATNGIIGFAYWIDFVVIHLFTWTSLLLGAFSTYQIQYVLMSLFNKTISWCFVMITSIAGGYGILLGREYRLNSWEAITDWSKVTGIIEGSLTSSSVFFCLLFGLFIGTVYVTIYVLINCMSASKEGKKDLKKVR